MHLLQTDPILRETDRKKWSEIFEELQILLRDGSILLFEAGMITAAEKEKYFMSGNCKAIGLSIQFQCYLQNLPQANLKLRSNDCITLTIYDRFQ